MHNYHIHSSPTPTTISPSATTSMITSLSPNITYKLIPNHLKNNYFHRTNNPQKYKIKVNQENPPQIRYKYPLRKKQQNKAKRLKRNSIVPKRRGPTKTKKNPKKLTLKVRTEAGNLKKLQTALVIGLSLERNKKQIKCSK